MTAAWGRKAASINRDAATAPRYSPEVQFALAFLERTCIDALAGAFDALDWIAGPELEEWCASR